MHKSGLKTKDFPQTSSLKEENHSVLQNQIQPPQASKSQVSTHLAKGLKIQIYPTEKQAKDLESWIGGMRWVWNWALNLQEKHVQAQIQNPTLIQASNQGLPSTQKPAKFKKLSENELSRQFTQLKKDMIERHKKGEDAPLLWLTALPRTSVTQVFHHLKQGWSNYFDSLSGKRSGPKVKKPTFKALHFSKKTISFQVDPRLENPLFHAGFQEKTKIQEKPVKEKSTTSSTQPKAYLKIPGLGQVEASFDSKSKRFAQNISTITITQKGSNWFASLICTEINQKDLSKAKKMPEITTQFKQDPYGVFALDSAVSHRGTGFNGKEFVKLDRLDKSTVQPRNPNCKLDNSKEELEKAKALQEEIQEKLHQKHMRSEKRKKRYQRSFSRKMRVRMKEKGLDPKKPIPKGTRLETSNRQKKVKGHIARINMHQANQRLDQAHKFTTEGVRNYHTIVTEKLNLNAMKQSLNKAFRRNYNLASPGQILHMFEYKCAWYGRTFIQVDPFFASSKICSVCKVKNKDLKLHQKTWTCPNCGVEHDRDENASVNLWLEGLRLLDLKLSEGFDVEHIKTLATSSSTLRSRESYEHGGGRPEMSLILNSPSNKSPKKCLSSSDSSASKQTVSL